MKQNVNRKLQYRTDDHISDSIQNCEWTNYNIAVTQLAFGCQSVN